MQRQPLQDVGNVHAAVSQPVVGPYACENDSSSLGTFSALQHAFSQRIAELQQLICMRIEGGPVCLNHTCSNNLIRSSFVCQHRPLSLCRSVLLVCKQILQGACLSMIWRDWRYEGSAILQFCTVLYLA